MVSWSNASMGEQGRLVRRPLTRNILAAFVSITPALSPWGPCAAPCVRAEGPPGRAAKLISPAQPAQSPANAIASHRAELAGLRNELRPLAVLQDTVRSDLGALASGPSAIRCWTSNCCAGPGARRIAVG